MLVSKSKADLLVSLLMVGESKVRRHFERTLQRNGTKLRRLPTLWHLRPMYAVRHGLSIQARHLPWYRPSAAQRDVQRFMRAVNVMHVSKVAGHRA